MLLVSVNGDRIALMLSASQLMIRECDEAVT